MRWKKLGRVYRPNPIHPKLATHAANPIAVWLENDLYRVFFGGRDDHNRTSVGFVDLDMRNYIVKYVHDRPVFEHGAENSFYSHGVSVGNCYVAQGHRYILFMGWQCRPGQHWRGDIGRLRLGQDFSLTLDESRPLLGTSEVDPVSLSYPWVLQLNGQYRMWYGSTMSWDAGNGEMLHVINHAVSNDGNVWSRLGLAIPYELGVAQAFSRPSVISDSDGFHMWFSYRSGKAGQNYRIGYAHSSTGEKWTLRLVDSGIDVSRKGWDSEMIEYPYVFDHKGHRYMLYNGNGYGRSGFGLAVLE